MLLSFIYCSCFAAVSFFRHKLCFVLYNLCFHFFPNFYFIYVRISFRNSLLLCKTNVLSWKYTIDLFCAVVFARVVRSNEHIEFNVVSVCSVICFSIEQIYWILWHFLTTRDWETGRWRRWLQKGGGFPPAHEEDGGVIPLQQNEDHGGAKRVSAHIPGQRGPSESHPRQPGKKRLPCTGEGVLYSSFFCQWGYELRVVARLPYLFLFYTARLLILPG